MIKIVHEKTFMVKQNLVGEKKFWISVPISMAAKHKLNVEGYSNFDSSQLEDGCWTTEATALSVKSWKIQKVADLLTRPRTKSCNRDGTEKGKQIGFLMISDYPDF